MRFKKYILILIIFPLCLSSFAFAEDNAGTGEGETEGYAYAFYRGAEWMYKVSVYVGLSDTANINTSINGYGLIGEPVYWRPSFPMPNNTQFTKHNKIQYLNGANISINNNYISIIDKDVPRIPITHNGNLNNVKSFFGDTDTLNTTIEKIAETYGTSVESLVNSIPFTINGETRTRDPNIILPIKGEDGKYKNTVPWAIIYEPVIIIHLRDGKTRVAFTATEYALTQKLKMFDWFFNGSNAQYVAGMTHQNLPNSIVLEYDWFGFRSYAPLGKNVYWSDDRIINGGGWGMRFLKANAKIGSGDEPSPGVGNEDIDLGDYRVDTDVVTSFWISSASEINSDDPAYVDFYIDGVKKARQWVVLPKGGSQVVWVKWHTPKTPKTVTINAVSSKGHISNSTQVKKVVDLNEYEPPDPRAMDYDTGKVIEKPKGFNIKPVPGALNKTSNEWSVYYDWWQENWVWHPRWVWNSNWVWKTTKWDEDGNELAGKWVDEGWYVDKGKWVDEGWYEFGQNHYWASIGTLKTELKPDEKVPTATRYYNEWTMKSGYGWNMDSSISLSTNDTNAVASQGNTFTLLPEYEYKGYLRLSERIGSRKFQLQENRFSTFNQRVHFTPLWYPDNKYSTYTRLIDIWTPSGHLYVSEKDEMNIKGSVLDDYKPVPSKVK